MDFAKKQLQKYGWVEGHGLGKEESGIIDPIKVSIKRDNGGVGLVPGEEFSNHWWSALFNKAAGNISVGCDAEQDKVHIKVKNEEEAAGSLRKKHYNSHRKSLLYGGFLDSSKTYRPDNNREKDFVEHCSSAVDQRKRVPSAESVLNGKHTISDDDLLRACKGRTAHKAARHGMLLSGKLKRIEEQESQLVADLKLQSESSTDEDSHCRGVSDKDLSVRATKKRKHKTSEIPANVCVTKKRKVV